MEYICNRGYNLNLKFLICWQTIDLIAVKAKLKCRILPIVSVLYLGISKINHGKFHNQQTRANRKSYYRSLPSITAIQRKLGDQFKGNRISPGTVIQNKIVKFVDFLLSSWSTKDCCYFIACCNKTLFLWTKNSNSKLFLINKHFQKLFTTKIN